MSLLHVVCRRGRVEANLNVETISAWQLHTLNTVIKNFLKYHMQKLSWCTVYILRKFTIIFGSQNVSLVYICHALSVEIWSLHYRPLFSLSSVTVMFLHNFSDDNKKWDEIKQNLWKWIYLSTTVHEWIRFISIRINLCAVQIVKSCSTVAHGLGLVSPFSWSN